MEGAALVAVLLQYKSNETQKSEFRFAVNKAMDEDCDYCFAYAYVTRETFYVVFLDRGTGNTGVAPNRTLKPPPKRV